MPAEDKYHSSVVNALKKAGWTIISEQIRLLVKKRYVYLDLQAQNQDNNQVILVEVKGFENIASPVSYLHQVVGQYIVYQAVMNYLGITHPLYLAVPLLAYQTFLQEEISQIVLNDAKIKLIVFDPDSEEITLWLN